MVEHLTLCQLTRQLDIRFLFSGILTRNQFGGYFDTMSTFLQIR